MARQLGQQFVLAFSLTLAGASRFSGAGWSQTVINTIQDLQNINQNLSGRYVLGGDIDATGFNFTPIGTFRGTFDGQGHAISGLTVGDGTGFDVGIFRQNYGSIRNVDLFDVQITSTGLALRVGGLVGFDGDVYGSGTIDNVHITGTVSGSGAVGGLVGAVTGGRITSSSAAVNVTGSGVYLGGLVGAVFASAIGPQPPAIIQSFVISVEKNSGTTRVLSSESLIRFVPIIESSTAGVATQMRPTVPAREISKSPGSTA